MEVTYKQEGKGNHASITHNGNPYKDDNLTILSDNNKNCRAMIPSVTIPGLQLRKIEVAAEDNDEIDLDITIGKDTWDFDLERITG